MYHFCKISYATSIRIVSQITLFSNVFLKLFAYIRESLFFHDRCRFFGHIMCHCLPLFHDSVFHHRQTPRRTATGFYSFCKTVTVT